MTNQELGERIDELTTTITTLAGRETRSDLHQRLTTLGILISMAATFIIGMNALVKTQSDSIREIIELNKEHNKVMQSQFAQKLNRLENRVDGLQVEVLKHNHGK